MDYLYLRNTITERYKDRIDIKINQIIYFDEAN